ncbi:glutamate racemase [Mariniflexile sp. AS56]|uniref:glutamate racemase n=1 Tax=Mariniflexile sp. AS56 TaxID=3063957 RepID=UPI0026EFFAE9|nr:glutamate racemase [Mariniflexile sp. AS56]MDO7172913.1 glutamate racemase [Mariniflexile sp. AS56]
MSKQPIGIFDSGVGGTSIWREINNLLPNENTIYLADSANAPYGLKTKEAITNLSIKNVEHLIKQDCKLIVVACNTATTNAISLLRDQFSIPIIGIEPAIKPAALNTQTKAIGILATKGTLSSELFHKTTDLFASNIKVVERIGEGIVELIESGQLQSEAMRSVLKRYLQPMIDVNIDYLVLGCTHYPYLMPLLIELLPNHVKIIDSGQAVARQTKVILEKHDLLNSTVAKGDYQFFTNGKTEVLASLLDNKFDVEYLNF